MESLIIVDQGESPLREHEDKNFSYFYLIYSPEYFPFKNSNMIRVDRNVKRTGAQKWRLLLLFYDHGHTIAQISVAVVVYIAQKDGYIHHQM